MSIKRSTASFAAVVNGVPQVIPVGYLIEDGHELLKGREHLFEPVETHLSRRERRPEQATAAPGEKRAVSRPQRRAPARGKGKDEKAGEGQ